MTKIRKSFLLHIDSLDILDELTSEEAGDLFKAIKDYQNDEELNLHGLVRVAFSPFKNQFVRDTEKYHLTCERRALAGSMGGKQKVANASKSKQKVANVADSVSKNKNDSKSVSDSKNDNKNDNKNNKDKEVKPKQAAPTLNFDTWSSNPSDDVLKEWLSHRKKRKLSVSQLVVNKMTKEINKAIGMGYSVDTCLSEVIERGWQGFNSDWIKNSNTEKTALHNLSNKDYSQHEGAL